MFNANFGTENEAAVLEWSDSMKAIDIFALCMVVGVVSFLGFAVENIWLAVTKGYMDNRNMIFPFLIGYGIAIMLLYLILGTPHKLWLFGRIIRIEKRMTKVIFYFTGSMLCVSMGEVLLGKFVEKVCHFYWWDYSKLPFHITRYTSLPTSAMFSCLITLFMDKVFLPLFYCFQKWDYTILRNTAIVLVAIMVGDFVYNAYMMYREKAQITRWKIDTTESWLYRKIHV